MYDQGAKFSSPLFAAFYLRDAEAPRESARIGFTTPRALGDAVIRNRIRRRVREAVRAKLDRVGVRWDIVINPRRRALTAPFEEIEREVEKLFQRCGS